MQFDFTHSNGYTKAKEFLEERNNSGLKYKDHPDINTKLNVICKANVIFEKERKSLNE